MTLSWTMLHAESPPSILSIERLQDLHPEPGDLVVLDVDETLIIPVSPPVHLWNGSIRDRWRTRLGDRWQSFFSLYWWTDPRQAVEVESPALIQRWRESGSYVMAMTSRQLYLPNGRLTHPYLLHQLAALKYEFSPCEGAPSGLAVVGGECKGQYLVHHVPLVQQVSRVWLVDDSRSTLERAHLSWKGEKQKLRLVLFKGAERYLPYDLILADYQVRSALEAESSMKCGWAHQDSPPLWGTFR